MKALLTLGLLIISAPVLAGQAQNDTKIPRNVWEQPSLEGVWNFSSNVPMQRSRRFGDRQFMTNEEVAELRARLAAADAAELALDMSDPIVAEIAELIDTRIRPAATQGGGDVVLRGYDAGMVYVEFKGSAFSLKGGVENMLRHYVPEVVGVADWRDALPKPGLDTPEAIAIQDLLESSINPSVAGHGGHISLIDIDGARAYIRMEGGCQGCGMADVTLKQGVQVEIQKVVPTIREVLDVTDHAGGTNPYYQSA